MDSTHTQRARDMDPSKMDAQQSPVDPMKTVRLLVGHYAAEQLTLDAGPPTEWTLSVVPAPAQDEDEKVTSPAPLLLSSIQLSRALLAGGGKRADAGDGSRACRRARRVHHGLRAGALRLHGAVSPPTDSSGKPVQLTVLSLATGRSR